MAISKDVILGKDVVIKQPDLVNLYGCSVGDHTKIGAFVEIQKNATIGVRCKISSHTFICEGVSIANDVFIGHGVMFTNDLYPRATNEGTLQQAVNPNMNTSLDLTVSPHIIHGISQRVIALPIFHSEMEDIEVYATATPRPAAVKTGLKIISYGLIGYKRKNLPISVDSYTPYKAHFETKTENNYLEMFKEYFPGYMAIVDGQRVSVLKSKDKQLVLIPIKKIGLHHVELVYEGFSIMRIAFYISMLAWFSLLIFFLSLWYKKRVTSQ